MNANGLQVLVVDDEPHICEVIRLYLEHGGYRPRIVHRASDALDALRAEQPAIILLDVMLPDRSGFELCRHIRSQPEPQRTTPIIMLTAKGESVDKLTGFHLGADDYIVKPFDPSELIARIQAVLRRAWSGTGAAPDRSTYEPHKTVRHGSLDIDLSQYRISVGGRRVELTPKEIELLHFLAQRPSRVFTREELLEHVWGMDFSGGTRTVDAHVKNLRKKLGEWPDWSIETLWGVGYRFEVIRNV